MLVGKITAINIDAVGAKLIQDLGVLLHHEGAPSWTRGRAARHVPVAHLEKIAFAAPLLLEVGIGSLDKAGRRVGQYFDPTLVCQFYEASIALGIYRGIFVAAEEPEGIVPIVEHLNDFSAFITDAIEFRRVVFIHDPGLCARILTQIVAALSGKIIRDQVGPHRGADRLRTGGDVVQTPTVIIVRILTKQRRDFLIRRKQWKLDAVGSRRTEGTHAPGNDGLGSGGQESPSFHHGHILPLLRLNINGLYSS